MATLMAEHRCTIIGLVFLTIFFLWMDISLYYKVQEIKPHSMAITSSQIFPTSVNSPSINSGALNSDSKNGASVYANNKNNEISSNLETEPSRLFSPFRGLSIKMMMMDQMNNYIFTPLAEIFNDITQLSKNFNSITPNMISAAGVFWAILAAKLVTYDNLIIHRLSVLFFQIRTFFDALDGIVARDHLGIKQHISLSNTSGYLVDGIADSIGFAAYLLGCYYYLRRNLPKFRLNSHHYLPVQVIN